MPPRAFPSSFVRPAGGRPAWRLGNRLLAPAGRPLVMGIVNVTPDSFYPASRSPAPEDALATALRQVEEGAEILDLGAASSRPGAAPVPPEIERARLLPVLRELRRRCDLPVTVDTCVAETARACLDEGADGVNDITAGDDPAMLPLVAARGAGLILMHMQGTPQTMQVDPRYSDVVTEVADWLATRAAIAETAGVAPDRIALDPGIGFGKRLEHNLALLAKLRLVSGTRPLLVGASRKSFIGELTGAPVDARLPGSLAALAAAADAAVTAVRVHDVAASRQFLDTVAAIGRHARDDPSQGLPPG